MVYSVDRSTAMVPVSLTHCCFVAYSTRRFVLSLALCYFVLVLEERVTLSVFRTFVRFALVWFCLFPLPLGVWEGLRLVIVARHGLFSYLSYTHFTQFDWLREKVYTSIKSGTGIRRIYFSVLSQMMTLLAIFVIF